MNKRIEELYKTIRDANRELDEIRDNCPHPSYRIGTYSHSLRVGQFDTMRICDECDSPLGYPSTDELIKFDREQIGL